MAYRKFQKNVIGTLHLGETVDVTDPCYNRDVWCRMSDVKIVPGEYECVAWLSDEGEWGTRVGVAGIYLGGVVPSQKSMQNIGEAGVDAGLAGFYKNKPDFSNDEWVEFCNIIHDEWPTMHLHDADFDGRLVGFTTSSGYGDGGYSVYAHLTEDGRATSLEIRFL